MQQIPSSADSQWFYEEKGQRLGGVDESVMIAMIKSGKLGYGSSVWRQGLSDWMKLEDTTLRTHLDAVAPPPLTGQHVSNTLVWVLAFAPILGFMLEAFVSGIVSGGNEHRAMRALFDGDFFYITVALNILLSVFDEKRLKKAGNNTDKFKGWVWLVPVYLYQRAKNLRQSLSYFIVWIVSFVLILATIS